MILKWRWYNIEIHYSSMVVIARLLVHIQVCNMRRVTVFSIKKQTFNKITFEKY